MKRLHICGMFIGMLVLFPSLHAQKRGLASINPTDLRTHMKFLASDELEGRDTGAPGLYVAARYLASQAEKIGLETVDGEDGYFQHYIIHERAYDRERSHATILTGNDSALNRDPFYIFPSIQGDRAVIEGEVVFAGYGIQDEEEGYDDLRDLDISGKIVMIMSRAPMNEDGTALRIGGDTYTGLMSFRRKLPAIYARQPKAVLVVYDPKSGIRSVEELSSGMANYMSRSRSLDANDREPAAPADRPRLVLINRTLADQLLETAGKDLAELQREIDTRLEPQSFLLQGTTLRMELQMQHTELEEPNVFGMIEGSDPELKDEMVLYLAHFDHVGTDGNGGIFNGADDNASGTVGLLEIAEAFKAEKKPPRRSIGFLWVSAEEIGLFGSNYFANHPLVPAEKIVTVINLDMIGRTKTKEDELSGRPGLTIAGGDTVKVIGGLQSSLLMQLNEESLKEMGMVGNYAFNDLNHPERYFYRSDHINFARKDIPVLFYSTGTHKDYHTITDTEDKIDYVKFEKMVRMSFNTGYKVAGYKDPITVDNPMSEWAPQSSSR